MIHNLYYAIPLTICVEKPNNLLHLDLFLAAITCMYVASIRVVNQPSNTFIHHTTNQSVFRTLAYINKTVLISPVRMEYDRALYRVYERILEDLMQTQPVSIHNTNTNGNGHFNGDDQPTQEIQINNGPGNSSGNGNGSQSIPFLFPLFLIRYAEIVNRFYSQGCRYHWRNRNPRSRMSVTTFNLFQNRNPFRSRSTSAFHRVDTSTDDDEDHVDSDMEEGMGIGMGQASAQGGGRHGSASASANGAHHRVDVEMTSLSQSTGLRRRNHSSSSSRDSNGSSGTEDQGGGTTNSNTNISSNVNGEARFSTRRNDSEQFQADAESDSVHNASIADANENRDDGPSPGPNTSATATIEQTETTRIAQQIAQRQRQRVEEQRQAEEVAGACTQKGLFAIMRICMLLAIFHLVVLGCLHLTYVGPRISKQVVTADAKSGRSLQGQGQKKGERMTCLEYALATRPEDDRYRKGFFQMFGESLHTDADADTNADKTKGANIKQSSETESSSDASVVNNDANKTAPLLGRNEILQIKIVYGDNCQRVPGQCSRVHNVIVPDSDSNSNSTGNATAVQIENKDKEKESFWNQIGIGGKDANGEMKGNDMNQYSTAEYWSKPAYKFSSNEALMFLDDQMLIFHNVSIVNVTLSERCLSTGSDQGVYRSRMTKFAQFLSQIYGLDAIVINQLMYGVKRTEGKYRNGYLQNMDSEERWMYSGSHLDTEKETRHNFVTWWSHRVGVLLVSFLAFFLVTSVTALIVRLLTSSGVMVMFPIFAALRAVGMNGADERVLIYSYPWVGTAQAAIRRQGVHPVNHYIGAHLAKLFLLYTMYESCQVAWSGFLYDKSIPDNIPLWIFGNAMVYEYFSMVFVRSALR